MDVILQETGICMSGTSAPTADLETPLIPTDGQTAAVSKTQHKQLGERAATIPEDTVHNETTTQGKEDLRSQRKDAGNNGMAHQTENTHIGSSGVEVG